MAAPHLYLFDDARARSWDPFSLTRPVCELLYGCLLQRERAERLWALECSGIVAGRELLGFDEPGAPKTVLAPMLAPGDTRILLSSRAVLEFGQNLPREGPLTLSIGGEVIGWVLPPEHAAPEEDLFAHPRQLPPGGKRVELAGEVLEHPWDILSGNADRIRTDIEHLHAGSEADVGDGPDVADGVHVLGDHGLSLGSGVTLEPTVVLDTREGPIRLDDGVQVRAFTRIQGPAYVGPDTRVLGGSLAHCSLGPVNVVRGEIASSVILGYSNKAHDGYLGHSIVGRWVNLGAGTTNSDLKNNYGSVRVRTRTAELDTGLMKVGCFLGDHVKTGIGTLLGTGTVVGAGSNLFGGAMPDRYVPPFSWGTGSELEPYRLEQFLASATAAMARRDMALSEEARLLLRRAWEASRVAAL